MNNSAPKLTADQQKARIDVRDAFRDNKIADAKPEELATWLKTLATTRSKHFENYSRDIIRAAYINHIQNSPLLRELDKENRWIHKWILGLTGGLVIFTVWLIILTVQLKHLATQTDENIRRIYLHIEKIQSSKQENGH
jgi:hypothetical protein